MRSLAFVLVCVAACGSDVDPLPCEGAGIGGRVVDSGGSGVAGARVTIEGPAGARAVRADSMGRFAVTDLTAGDYVVGASARDLAYVERAVTVADACTEVELELGPESDTGEWANLGPPGNERFGGTNSAVLLPTGRILMCHNTIDPILVDPVTMEVDTAGGSTRIQGCHAVTALPDGDIIYVGGADQPVYGPGTTQVKVYHPTSDTWEVKPDLQIARWYPSLAILPDGRLLTMGGGTVNNPERTDTSELMDPTSMNWTQTDSVAVPNEVSPTLTLLSGEVLMTHRPPQLFDPESNAWRSTMDFQQGDRMPNGDHADHELQMLPDGRVAAIGYKTFDLDIGRMLEIYDPSTETWSFGADVLPVRYRASTIMGMDGRVVVIGGTKADSNDATPTNEWNQVYLVDQWDPARDAWRRLGDTEVAREYHAMPVLVPDGRIFVTGGEGQPGNEPATSTIEAFTPPYLRRGPRPELVALDTTDLTRGTDVTLTLGGDEAITQVVMMGATATTHFMDAGPNRYLSLEFEQTGDSVVAHVPTDAATALPGWYLLFALVDDIPSVAQMVRITP